MRALVFVFDKNSHSEDGVRGEFCRRFDTLWPYSRVESLGIDAAGAWRPMFAEIRRSLDRMELKQLRETLLVAQLPVEWPDLDRALVNGLISNDLVAVLRKIAWTYPEVAVYCIGQCYDSDRDNLEDWFIRDRDAISWARSFPYCSTGLFDNNGMRSFFRKKYNQYVLGEMAMARQTNRPGIAQYLLPEREPKAATIDEEYSYQYFNSYCAYRSGYRCTVVSSYSQLRNLFETDHNLGFSLSLEDRFLNYPDKDPSVHLSNPVERLSRLPGLRNITHRVEVSAGHGNYEAKELAAVRKPTNGMFSFIAKADLQDEFDSRRKEEWDQSASAARRFLDPEYHGLGHGSTGELYVTAVELLERASSLRKSEDVPSLVHGAVLALEALELLNYRTPTISMESMAVRHELEVKAECMFFGVDHAIGFQGRFDEIRREATTVSKWYATEQQERSSRSAEMRILTQLARVLRDSGQFDEEQLCLARYRKVQARKLRAPAKWGLWYYNELMARFWLYPVFLAIWPLLGASLTWCAGTDLTGRSHPEALWTIGNYLQNIKGAFIVFFGVQPATSGYDLSTFAFLMTVLGMLAGLAHLGIFVSYLYSKLSRK